MRKYSSSGAFLGIMVRAATEREREKEPLPSGGFSEGFSQGSSVFGGENGLGQESINNEQRAKSREQIKIRRLGGIFPLLIANCSLLIFLLSLLIC
jgi:hypothetical protein